MNKILAFLISFIITFNIFPLMPEASDKTLSSVFFDIDNTKKVIYIDHEATAKSFVKMIAGENIRSLSLYDKNGNQLSNSAKVTSGNYLLADGEKYVISDAVLKVLNDDFEKYGEGSFLPEEKWKVNEKASTGGNISIVSDGDNSYCSTTVNFTQGATSFDSYISTVPADLSKKTILSFKIANTMPANGTVAVLLRSDQDSEVASKGRFSLINISNTGIKYFPGTLDISESATGWQDIKIVFDGVDVKLYNKGVMKAHIEDVTVVDDGQISDFNFARSAVRFSTTLSKKQSGAYANALLDDVRLYNDISSTDEISLSAPEYSSEYNGKEYTVDSLDDGNVTAKVYFDRLTENVKNIGMFMAYRDNGVLKDIKFSNLNNFATSGVMENEIAIKDINDNQLLSVYLVNSKNLQPIGEVTNLSKKVVEMPTETVVLKDFENMKNTHPRIMATEIDFERINSEVSSNQHMAAFATSTIAAAERILSKSLDDTADYDTEEENYNIQYLIPDGLRLLTMSRRVLDFVTKLSMAYKVTGEDKYAQKVWEILERAGVGYDDNPPFPNWNSDKHFLDTAEMSAAFSIGYDWCYDYLNDTQRAYIERSIKEYALDPSMDYYTKQKEWTQDTNNWNSVCNGGMLLGAVAVMDVYPEQSAFIISNAVNSIKAQLVFFAPDGGWFEGTGYWNYTMRYLAKMLSTLKSGLGTDYGLSAIPGIDKTGDFILHAQGPTGTNNYSDTSAQKLYPPELYLLSKLYNNPGLAESCLENDKEGGPLQLLWFDSSITDSGISLANDAYFREVEAVSLRESWDNDAMYLSFHGGKSVASHSHLDCGSFVIDCLGERWAEDLPAENYNYEGYFTYTDEKRFSYYRTRAEGHNVFVINPDLTGGQDLDADTPVTKFSSGDNCSFAIMDLSSAYKNNALSALRGYRLDDNKKCAVIRDEISLKSSGSPIYWFMHTKANVTFDGNVATLTKNGKTMKAEFFVEGGSAEFSVVKAKPLETSPERSQNSNPSYRKIQVKVTDGKNVSITVKIYPGDGNAYNANLSELNLW